MCKSRSMPRTGLFCDHIPQSGALFENRVPRLAHSVLHRDRPILPEEEDGTFGMRFVLFSRSMLLTYQCPVIDILVKAYFPGTSAFKPGGTLSNYLDVMVEGKKLEYLPF